MCKHFLFFIASIVFFFGCSKASQIESNVLTAKADEEILYFVANWDKGEGEFQWPGRCSDHGYRNYVKVDWSNHKLTCHVTKFTNLSNVYYAYPGYRVGLYRGNDHVKTIDVYVVATPDEDCGSEPTYIHKKATRHFSKDITRIEIQQIVDWCFWGDPKTERKPEENLHKTVAKQEPQKKT